MIGRTVNIRHMEPSRTARLSLDTSYNENTSSELKKSCKDDDCKRIKYYK